MASALLQLNPDDRVGAEDGLQHAYFAQLPKKLYELPDGELIARALTCRYRSLSCFRSDRNINIHRGRRLLVSGAES